MSMAIGPVLIPNSACRATSEATFAEWITFLLGRHATLGQDPPTYFRSMTAIRLPSLAMVHVITLPAVPPPSTMASYLSGALILIYLLGGKSRTATADNLAGGWGLQSEM